MEAVVILRPPERSVGKTQMLKWELRLKLTPKLYYGTCYYSSNTKLCDLEILANAHWVAKRALLVNIQAFVDKRFFPA